MVSLDSYLSSEFPSNITTLHLSVNITRPSGGTIQQNTKYSIIFLRPVAYSATELFSLQYDSNKNQLLAFLRTSQKQHTFYLPKIIDAGNSTECGLRIIEQFGVRELNVIQDGVAVFSSSELVPAVGDEYKVEANTELKQEQGIWLDAWPDVISDVLIVSPGNISSTN